MTLFSEATRVYVVLGATDMRKSFDTLAGLVKEVIREDPLTGHAFVFSNRHRNRIKLLWWDGTGLCVLAKRLERGRFPWPRRDDESLEMTRDDLWALLGWAVKAREPECRSVEQPRAKPARHWYDWNPGR